MRAIIARQRSFTSLGSTIACRRVTNALTTVDAMFGPVVLYLVLGRLTQVDVFVAERLARGLGINMAVKCCACTP